MEVIYGKYGKYQPKIFLVQMVALFLFFAPVLFIPAGTIV